MDDKSALETFTRKFAALDGKKILVHGGGKLATALAKKLDVPQQMLEGRRITDGETLDIVTMVYAGLINKQLVARLQAAGVNALGFSGADGNLLRAHKRTGPVDYGFAGDVDLVNADLLSDLLEKEMVPVVCPITHDGSGQLLNTNADTIAAVISGALASRFEVQLVFSFEKPGVLKDAADNSSVITQLKESGYASLKEQKLVFAGMVPKLDNAFAAKRSGVQKVSVGRAIDLDDIIKGQAGTEIIA